MLSKIILHRHLLPTTIFIMKWRIRTKIIAIMWTKHQQSTRSLNLPQITTPSPHKDSHYNKVKCSNLYSRSLHLYLCRTLSWVILNSKYKTGHRHQNQRTLASRGSWMYKHTRHSFRDSCSFSNWQASVSSSRPAKTSRCEPNLVTLFRCSRNLATPKFLSTLRAFIDSKRTRSRACQRQNDKVLCRSTNVTPYRLSNAEQMGWTKRAKKVLKLWNRAKAVQAHIAHLWASATILHPFQVSQVGLKASRKKQKVLIQATITRGNNQNKFENPLLRMLARIIWMIMKVKAIPFQMKTQTR